LLEEGKRALREHGPSGLSLRDVARRAAVSQAAPYRHFDGKEGLLAALAAEGFRGLERTTRAAAAQETDPVRKLLAMGLAYVRFARANPEIYPLMFGSVRKRRDVEVAAAGEQAFARLIEAVATCQASGALRAGNSLEIGTALTALCHGIATFSLDGRTPPNTDANADVDAFTERALTQHFNGLRPRLD
jgi:AcrR family transcriptional regulator